MALLSRSWEGVLYGAPGLSGNLARLRMWESECILLTLG